MGQGCAPVCIGASGYICINSPLYSKLCSCCVCSCAVKDFGMHGARTIPMGHLATCVLMLRHCACNSVHAAHAAALWKETVFLSGLIPTRHQAPGYMREREKRESAWGAHYPHRSIDANLPLSIGGGRLMLNVDKVLVSQC